MTIDAIDEGIEFYVDTKLRCTVIPRRWLPQIIEALQAELARGGGK